MIFYSQLLVLTIYPAELDPPALFKLRSWLKEHRVAANGPNLCLASVRTHLLEQYGHQISKKRTSLIIRALGFDFGDLHASVFHYGKLKIHNVQHRAKFCPVLWHFLQDSRYKVVSADGAFLFENSAPTQGWRDLSDDYGRMKAQGSGVGGRRHGKLHLAQFSTLSSLFLTLHRNAMPFQASTILLLTKACSCRKMALLQVVKSPLARHRTRTSF